MPHQSGGLTVVVEHRLALVAKAGMMRIDCDTILGNEEALPREIERLEPIDRTRLDRKVFARPEPTHRPGVESSGRPILRQNDGTRRRRRTEFGRDDLREMRRRKPFCRARSEEHTSALQSLMRTSYAVFCLKKDTTPTA